MSLSTSELRKSFATHNTLAAPTVGANEHGGTPDLGADEHIAAPRYHEEWGEPCKSKKRRRLPKTERETDKKEKRSNDTPEGVVSHTTTWLCTIIY